MTNQHHVDIGDTVRVGKGYQRWTVTGRDGDNLTLQSDPKFAEIAGSTSRRKTTTVDRVQLIGGSAARWVATTGDLADTSMGVDYDWCTATPEGVESMIESARNVCQYRSEAGYSPHAVSLFVSPELYSQLPDWVRHLVDHMARRSGWCSVFVTVAERGNTEQQEEPDVNSDDDQGAGQSPGVAWVADGTAFTAELVEHADAVGRARAGKTAGGSAPMVVVQDETQQVLSGTSDGGKYSASELVNILIRAGRSEGITLPDRTGVLDQLEEGYYVYSPDRFDDTPGAVVAAAYDSLKGREADVQDYRDERMVVVLREADVAELRGEEEYMWEQLSHHRASDFGVNTVTLVPDDECQPDFPG